MFVFFVVENKYSTYEQRVASIPSDALYKQMNVLDKVTENALKVRDKVLRWSLKALAIIVLNVINLVMNNSLNFYKLGYRKRKR